MQVEMNGEIIVGIAMLLIVVLAIGLIAYYIRKGREERTQASAGASATDGESTAADAND